MVFMWRRLEDGPIIYRVSNCCATVLKVSRLLKKEGKKKKRKLESPNMREVGKLIYICCIVYSSGSASVIYICLEIDVYKCVPSRSEAKDLFGDDWVQRHRRVVQQHANQYKRIAWAKVTNASQKIEACWQNMKYLALPYVILQCLSIQGLTSSGGTNSMGVDGKNSSGVSRALVKERLKTFNMQFEDLHQRQSQWTVPDTELLESLRLAVAEVLLPAYRSFIKRFGPMVESGKNPQKYIRYSAEDLERMLGEFFEGKTLNEPKR